jgi:integrase
MKNLTENKSLQIIPNNSLIPTSPNQLLLKFDKAFYNLHNHIECSKQEILDTKQKIKKKQTKRDAVELDFLIQILKQPRKKREKHLCFSQFRLAVCLLFLTGSRVNEIRNLQRKQVLLENHSIIINQSKTSSLRKIVFGTKSIKLLKSLQLDIDLIFSQQENRSLGLSLSTRKFYQNHCVNSHISSHSWVCDQVIKNNTYSFGERFGKSPFNTNHISL